MGYRKFKGDYLFTGYNMLNDNSVLIAKEDGEIISVINEGDAGDDVEKLEGIITPGFINAHCHLELSHMKGLVAEKTGLVDFVYRVINERHFAEEEIQEAIAIAEQQMMESGIVAVGDICNNTFTLPQKLLHNITYYNFIEVSGWSPAVAQMRFERSKTFYDEFLKKSLVTSLVPHAPYSVSDNLWKYISPFFKNKTTSIHNQETMDEDEFFLKGTGDLIRMYEIMNIDNSFFLPAKKSSVQTYFQKLSEAASVILVHNTFTSQEDIDYIKSNKKDNQLVSFCICPNANLYIENTFPPVEMFIKNNCPLVLGTDSLASNWSLNLLDEIKTIQKHLPFLSTEKILQFATINGAKALQMEKTFGSFESGKSPGVVLIQDVEKDGKLKQQSTSKRIF